MRPRFLTANEIVDFHAVAMEEYSIGTTPPDLSLRDPNGPAAIAALAEQAYEYTNDLFQVAAAYVLYVNQRHPWVDGNKRVAAGCCVRFLSWNGIATQHSTKRLEQLILSVADHTNQRSRESIAYELRNIYG